MNTNNRFTSLAVVLLICAPLTSLYSLLVPGSFVPVFRIHVSSIIYQQRKHVSDAPFKGTHPASISTSGLKLHVQDWHERAGEFITAGNFFWVSMPSMATHHWSIILPWCISLILGVIVPIILSVAKVRSSNNQEEVLDDEEDDEYAWILRCNEEKRLSGFVSKYKKFHKVLESSNMDLAEYDSEGIPRWKIPFAGKETGDTTRCVDGTCAICMGTYICGDEVIWSSNPNCPHVYHEACLSLWLSHSHKECPCCRQQFLLTE